MIVQQHSIETRRTAFYFTIGNLESPDDLWLVFHGYGQQADEFLQPFLDFDMSKHAVVAPEGLSKFYKGENFEKAVSSWMTRRFRLSEIDDQLNYIDQIYSIFKDRARRIHVLGFSQGVATVARWVYYRQPEIASLTLWAGWPPEDINYSELKSYWKDVKCFYVYGDDDKYVTEERIASFYRRGDLLDLGLEIIKFEGTHRLSRTVLKQLAEKMTK